MTTEVRPAATVVVLRPPGPSPTDAAQPEPGPGPEPELYMLRRSSKSAFMPDALVFPGGRVEAEDDDGSGDLDRVFARAARRECMEEASLALASAGLRWFDTWQTPSGESPRRFLARFYLTTIAPDQGHEAIADGVETRAGRWATASAILAAWEAEEVDLPPPTLSILLRLAAGDWRGWLEQPPERAREPILPKIAAIGSSIHIVMPHDPDYASLPGEAGPVPERVHLFPRRFVRAGKRWVPQP